MSCYRDLRKLFIVVFVLDATRMVSGLQEKRNGGAVPQSGELSEDQPVFTAYEGETTQIPSVFTENGTSLILPDGTSISQQCTLIFSRYFATGDGAFVITVTKPSDAGSYFFYSQAGGQNSFKINVATRPDVNSPFYKATIGLGVFLGLGIVIGVFIACLPIFTECFYEENCDYD